MRSGEYFDPQALELGRLLHRLAFGEFFSALLYVVISSGAVLSSGALLYNVVRLLRNIAGCP